MELLRSWVQLPPGPFLPVVQLRYWIELDFNNCRTKTSSEICYECRWKWTDRLTNNPAFDEALDWGPAVITIQARHFQ